jgi:hypothetical protein
MSQKSCGWPESDYAVTIAKDRYRIDGTRMAVLRAATERKLEGWKRRRRQPRERPDREKRWTPGRQMFRQRFGSGWDGGQPGRRGFRNDGGARGQSLLSRKWGGRQRDAHARIIAGCSHKADDLYVSNDE